METHIPKTFKIFSDKYTVKHYKKIDKEDSMGEHDYMKKTIKIKRDMPLEEKERTYYHELFHCLLEQLGYGDLSDNETFVDNMSSALYQVLKTSK